MVQKIKDIELMVIERRTSKIQGEVTTKGGGIVEK